MKLPDSIVELAREYNRAYPKGDPGTLAGIGMLNAAEDAAEPREGPGTCVPSIPTITRS